MLSWLLSHAAGEARMNSRKIYIVVAVVAILAILGYTSGWFGGATPPPAVTAPAPTPAAPAEPAPATPAPTAPAQ
jgi:hypothetical protein